MLRYWLSSSRHIPLLILSRLLLLSVSTAVMAENAPRHGSVSTSPLDLPTRSLDAAELLDWTLAADDSCDPANRAAVTRLTLERLQLETDSATASLGATVTQLVVTRRPASPVELGLDTGQDLFRRLHDNLLTGEFEPGCGRLSHTLDTGCYNCLTATVLYLAACRQTGLTAVPLAAPGHVCVLLSVGGEDFVIELTQPAWRPIAYRPPHKDLRRISDQSLLGRVYYNLGIEHATHAHWEAAQAAAELACLLDPDDLRARDNLLAILNNRHTDMLQEHSVRTAEQRLQATKSRLPGLGWPQRGEKLLNEFDTAKHPE